MLLGTQPLDFELWLYVVRALRNITRRRGREAAIIAVTVSNVARIITAIGLTREKVQELG